MHNGAVHGAIETYPNTFEQGELMQQKKAQQWYEQAMLRPNGVSEEESERRRQMVQAHHRAEGTEPDCERAADYELYILGKMDIEEYQQYLLFKYKG
jgi:hypothetical protein